MPRDLESVDVGDVPELLTLAEEVRATHRGRVLRRNGEDIALLLPLGAQTESPTAGSAALEHRIWNDVGVRDPDDLWADYDPERVRAAILHGAGILKAGDVDAILDEIAAARGQDSRGRPAS